MEIRPNTKIRDYLILSELGRGGMGTVYLAEDQMLSRKVAIKVLNPSFTAEARFTERFQREARLQASLDHPNIVTLYSFFQEDGNFFMVMELVETATLKDIIIKKGPIPEKRAAKLFSSMLEGVEYAHKKGIIHRDLKPSNILVRPDDSIKIMDFGIAKLMGEEGLTKAGSNVGTIKYMSPEQVKAGETVDFRTDIYSLGVTYFEMLTGKSPYESKETNDFELMKAVVEEDLPNPRDFYPFISQKSVDLISGMCKKNRDERLKDLREAIKLLKDEKPSEHIKKETKPIFEYREPRKSRFGQAFAAFFLFILILGLFAYIYFSEKGSLPSFLFGGKDSTSIESPADMNRKKLTKPLRKKAKPKVEEIGAPATENQETPNDSL